MLALLDTSSHRGQRQLAQAAGKVPLRRLLLRLTRSSRGASTMDAGSWEVIRFLLTSRVIILQATRVQHSQLYDTAHQTLRYALLCWVLEMLATYVEHLCLQQVAWKGGSHSTVRDLHPPGHQHPPRTFPRGWQGTTQPHA